MSIFYDKIMINKKTARSLLLKWVRKLHNCYEHRFTTVRLFVLQANGNVRYRYGCVKIKAEIERLFFKARGKRSQQSKYCCSKGVMLQAAQPTCSLRIPGILYRLKDIQQQEDLKWKESFLFRIIYDQ